MMKYLHAIFKDDEINNWHSYSNSTTFMMCTILNVYKLAIHKITPT